MSYDCIHYSHINDLLCIFIYANAKTWAERFANQACRSGFAMETAILEFSTKWIAHVLQKQSSVTQWGWLRSYFELIKWNTVQYALHFARVVVIKYTIWHQNPETRWLLYYASEPVLWYRYITVKSSVLSYSYCRFHVLHAGWHVLTVHTWYKIVRGVHVPLEQITFPPDWIIFTTYTMHVQCLWLTVS